MNAGGPVRLRLSRQKGFSLAALSEAVNGREAVIVARPGRWGNPFAIAAIAAETGLPSAQVQAEAVSRYGRWLAGQLDPALSPGPAPTEESVRAALRGRNLACWCAPGTPCHADILLALANRAL
ncbi:DUF4326 domain-containing protein [Arsenicitalea aurantiaca]|nr:DUF4326 domain-containing protein [Arsenicitalea aurantiaca]